VCKKNKFKKKNLLEHQENLLGTLVEPLSHFDLT